MPHVARVSQGFYPTLRDAPVDAVAVSHQLLLRAGFIRQSAAGLYSFLPLGWRTIRRLERIIREEMESVGAQEFLLPGLQSAELWRASGRWESVDETLFRLRDRRGSDYCLAMTHEEAFTQLARGELRSYRQLPQLWYQIGTKFRDEQRPRAGLLRVREFLMKDAYSFDRDSDGLDAAFATMATVYQRIYARCGLEAYPAEAWSGAMGGRQSVEFVIRTEAGEDEVMRCTSCGYTANAEVATARVSPVADEPSTSEAPEPFATPGVLTIEALAAPPYSVSPQQQLKTLVYVVGAQPVVLVLRGDHMLNDAKLQLERSAATVRPAEVDEVFGLMRAHPGSLGAVALHGATVLADAAVVDRKNMVTGANRDGFHLRGVDVARDIIRSSSARVVDIRRAGAGEGCPRCADGVLESFPALEVGHIFKLGTRYSERLGATFLDESGSEMPLVMGSYGIGLGRLVAAVAEQHHDSDGIIWPGSVSPYDVTVLTLGAGTELEDAAERIIAQLEAAGLDVVYDDRDARPGVKLKDADLIGIPIRIAISPRSLASGAIEWKRRGTTEMRLIPLDAVAAEFDSRPR